MAKYIITETRPAIQIWKYEVEAENTTEALNIVLEGETEAYECTTEEQWSEDDESYFDIEKKQ
jgi:hypothetical protein